jgi:hypothetical protein
MLYLIDKLVILSFRERLRPELILWGFATNTANPIKNNLDP